MTRVTRVTVDRSCAICERTLLMGEQAIRFSPNGGADYVDVCPLCADTALENGWVREGAPTTPMLESNGPRRRRGLPEAREQRPPPPARLPLVAARDEAEDGGGDGVRADPAATVGARAADG